MSFVLYIGLEFKYNPPELPARETVLLKVVDEFTFRFDTLRFPDKLIFPVGIKFPDTTKLPPIVVFWDTAKFPAVVKLLILFYYYISLRQNFTLIV